MTTFTLLRVTAGLASAALILSASIGATPAAASDDATPGSHERAPLLGVKRASAIDGRYVVVLDPTTGVAARTGAVQQAQRHGGTIAHQYGAALNGFAGRLPDPAVEALRNNPHVAYIEADQVVSVSTTQENATWGLDRVDQRDRPLNSRYIHERNGAGVTAYILDTGIRRTHQQFGTRVAPGFNAFTGGSDAGDCNGHGTHVAGTVGSRRYGVAKAVTLRPVRVLDCQGYGSNADVIAGINWLTAHHTGNNPAVANVSLGGSPAVAVDDAMRNSIFDGVTYAVAAGNSNTDACSGSPGRVMAAVTVGSTNKVDERSRFSNFGPCVDIFAPGSGITSTWNSGDQATRKLSGTSMAAPHVAGAAALYLQKFPTATPAMVRQALISGATSGRITGEGTRSPDRLLFSRVNTAPTSPPGPSGNRNLVRDPGFESGSGWTSTAGVITSRAGFPARNGVRKAWLNGDGVESSDELEQIVPIPEAGSATLVFHLLIDTDEVAGAPAYDKLRVGLVADGKLTRLVNFSNKDAGTGYVRRTLNVSAFTGETVMLRFVGTEDFAYATDFVIDDVSITTG